MKSATITQYPQLKAEVQCDPARVKDLLAEVQRHDPSVRRVSIVAILLLAYVSYRLLGSTGKESFE